MPFDCEIEGFNRVHFIGIGGIGMSGIASVAKSQGMEVSGSDLKDSKVARALRKQGIDVRIGHSAKTIEEIDPEVVVISSAIPERNPELRWARERGVPVWARAQMLAYVCRSKKILAVAGTHGKTTTSSILASAMVKLDADPSFLVGGIIDGHDTNARYGSGDACVIEADESDGSFIYVTPYIAIVTNIEEDHLDHYGNLDAIKSAFADFLGAIPADGLAIVCADCEGLVELAKGAAKCDVVSYGFGSDADIKVTANDDGSCIAGFKSGQAKIKLGSNPGTHNMLNATAAVIALEKMGYTSEKAAEAVSAFSGVRRRFDLVGKCNGITVIDDYGHHPTEIRATLKAASSMGFNRTIVLFQPHRYSRTQALADQFATAFDDADYVAVMDVYSAGEAPIPGITGKTIVDAVKSHDPAKSIDWFEGRADVVDRIVAILQPGDLIFTMGAGDITAIGPQILEALESPEYTTDTSHILKNPTGFQIREPLEGAEE